MAHVTFSRRLALLAGSAALALNLVSGPAAAEGTLRIATEGTYFPWSYVDDKGELTGWDVDIANELCARLEVECEINAQEWEGIIPGLVAGKYDLIVASMSMTPARRERVEFSRKYKESISRFVAKAGSITDTSPEGMKGKRIGVQKGSSQDQWLVASGYDKTAEIVYYENTQGPELDLVSGRIDAMIGNQMTYYVNFLKRDEAKGFDFVGEEYKGGVLGEGNAIAMRKGEPELKAKVDAVLDAMLADGTYDAISAKYFPFPLMEK